MSATTNLVDRLVGVKQTAPGRWIARCPGHGDKSPSLSIREMEDGRVLLHCFAGCPNGDVLQALGLRMSDLFDKPIAQHLAPIRRGFSARELLELLAHEATVAALLTGDALTRQLSVEEQARLTQAADRLLKAQALSHGR
jgi:hypothetical protein